MSNYKRLTTNNRDEYDPEYDFCIDCKYFGEPNGCNRPNGTCGNYDRFLETYNRLAELEDKIENGTLVVVNKPFYSDQFNAWCMYLKEGDYIISARLTKEQADSKLKELQEKQK